MSGKKWSTLHKLRDFLTIEILLLFPGSSDWNLIPNFAISEYNKIIILIPKKNYIEKTIKEFSKKIKICFTITFILLAIYIIFA